MQQYNEAGIVNIGTGQDQTIAELAAMVADALRYKGELVYDRTKPDGTPQKLLDVCKISALGWQAKTDLRQGLAKTYAWFVDNY